MTIDSRLKIVRRVPYVSLFFTLLAVLIHLFHGWRLDLLYERDAVSELELWRMLTSHWVHLNSDHLFWSTATFFFLGSICEVLDRRKTLTTLGFAAILIPLGLWWAQPTLLVYGGLSGLDCAFYALLFSLLLKRDWESGNRGWAVFYSCGMIALLAKVTYETVTGQTIFVANTHSGMVPVPLSHLVGGAAGLMVGLIDTINGRLQPNLRLIWRRKGIPHLVR